jgi:hypothetical protein
MPSRSAPARGAASSAAAQLASIAQYAPLEARVRAHDAEQRMHREPLVRREQVERRGRAHVPDERTRCDRRRRRGDLAVGHAEQTTIAARRRRRAERTRTSAPASTSAAASAEPMRPADDATVDASVTAAGRGTTADRTTGMPTRRHARTGDDLEHTQAWSRRRRRQSSPLRAPVRVRELFAQRQRTRRQ